MSEIKRYMEEKSSPVFLSVCLSERTLGISGPEDGDAHRWRTDVYSLHRDEVEAYANALRQGEIHRQDEGRLATALVRSSDPGGNDDELPDLGCCVAESVADVYFSELDWLECLQEKVLPRLEIIGLGFVWETLGSSRVVTGMVLRRACLDFSEEASEMSSEKLCGCTPQMHGSEPTVQ